MAFALLQDSSEESHGIGLIIIVIKNKSDAPLSKTSFKKHFPKRIKTTKGSHAFALSAQVCGYYLLQTGNYIILVFTEKPDTEKRYSLSIGSRDILGEVRCVQRRPLGVVVEERSLPLCRHCSLSGQSH